MRKILTVAAAVSSLLLSIANAYAGDGTPAKVGAEAKITEQQAKAIALTRVPNGVVKSAELEREHGRLVWSFDVVRAGQGGVTEIQVDALTSKVVSTKHETAVAEANELKAERLEATAAKQRRHP
ncbi:PepSY domain-containing protein [Massilia sp. R2A-15]|uniref:PepSY domain-containing protein n=1 Tax=Massilia sp. R2A-15 TaxID=3064278 RepID=UPI002734B3C0|nr:PepSY domain-containing protein [Massilia sp. R2A-15]WLI91177.1 PepSY domain-containing protein [Massilia sp. R2A-15]